MAVFRLPKTPHVDDLDLSRPANAAIQVLKAAFPRMVLTSAIPSLLFVGGSTFLGITGGAVLALAAAGTMFMMSRRKGRNGFLAAMVIGFVATSALAAILSRQLSLYFLPTIAIDLLMCAGAGLSLLAGKPLFAQAPGDLIKIPPVLLRTPEHARAGYVATVIAMGYFLARGAIRLIALLTLPEVWFVVVAIACTVIGDSLFVFTGARIGLGGLRKAQLSLAAQAENEPGNEPEVRAAAVREGREVPAEGSSP